jgi:hypothetical protein
MLAETTIELPWTLRVGVPMKCGLAAATDVAEMASIARAAAMRRSFRNTVGGLLLRLGAAWLG